MKSSSVVGVVLVSIVMSGVANAAIDAATKQIITDAGLAFTDCRTATANSPEGELVYNQIMAFSRDSDNKPALMMESRKLTAKQKNALKVVYLSTKECQATYLNAVQGTPAYEMAQTRFAQIDTVYNNLIGGKAVVALSNLAMSQIREDSRAKLNALLGN